MVDLDDILELVVFAAPWVVGGLLAIGFVALIFVASEQSEAENRACAEQCHPYVWAMTTDRVCVCAQEVERG